MNEDKRVIVMQAKKGNRTAFEQLYQLYYEEMYQYAFKLCNHNEADAHEMTQEAFLSAFKYIQQLDNVDYFRPWLRSIVHSKCARMFYRNRDALYDPVLLHRSQLSEKRISHQPEQAMSDRTDQEIIRSLVDDLTPKLREVVELYYFQQKSIKEIIAILELPSGTVKSRIFQARKILKEKIQHFERIENRKISFHMNVIVPSFITLMVSKLASSKILQSMKFIQVTQVISASALVVVTTVTVVETKQYVEHTFNPAPMMQVEEENTIPKQVKQELAMVEFPELTYQNETILTPKSAYYVLLRIAPEPKDIETLSKEDLQNIQPIVNALQNSNTNYVETLKENGWLTMYNQAMQV